MSKIYGHLKMRMQAAISGASAGDNNGAAATIALEGLLAAIVANLATAYTAMFASRMGASSTQIGLVSSLPQLFALAALLPGALLFSRLRDHRRPVEIALIMAGLFYGIAGFAPYFNNNLRVWFLIGMVALANAPIALYNATWQNYFSNVIPPAGRNAAYTLRTSMTFVAGVIIVQLAGIILGSATSDLVRIRIYQICYWLAFLISVLQYLVLRRAPQDHTAQPATGWRDLLSALKESVRSRPFRTFCLISLVMHSGWYLAWPLFFLTQVNFLGANEAWLSYIAVPGNILIWLTVRPWSRFIEKHGIRFTLVIGCFGLAINPLLTAASAYLPAGWGLPALLIFNLLNGLTFSAFQLTVLQCLLEVVPPRYKALNLSFYTTLLLLANTLMPMIGVQIFNALGADLRAMTLAMAVSTVVRLAGTILFYWRWRTLRHEPDCGKRD